MMHFRAIKVTNAAKSQKGALSGVGLLEDILDSFAESVDNTLS